LGENTRCVVVVAAAAAVAVGIRYAFWRATRVFKPYRSRPRGGEKVESRSEDALAFSKIYGVVARATATFPHCWPSAEGPLGIWAWCGIQVRWEEGEDRTTEMHASKVSPRAVDRWKINSIVLAAGAAGRAEAEAVLLTVQVDL